MKNTTQHSPAASYMLLATLFLIAFLTRTVWHLGPNIEFVTTAMLLSAAYLGKRQSLWLTLTIMVSTDLILGNSNIFLFTWSGFLIPAFLLPILFKNLKLITKNFQWKILSLTGTGLLANLFFFVHTNFGVWLLGSMYPKTASGLLMSYVNALPFLRYQTAGTLLFVPVGFVLTEVAISLNKKFQIVVKAKTALNSIANSPVR
jgi:hypothetical protein